MGTSAGVVSGASAGSDINHDVGKSLANPRVGVQCREMESRSAALPMLKEALLPAFYDMGTGGSDRKPTKALSLDQIVSQRGPMAKRSREMGRYRLVRSWVVPRAAVGSRTGWEADSAALAQVMLSVLWRGPQEGRHQ
jgi:hypothetical protein